MTEEWLPYALIYGMTQSEFWESTPRIFKAYEKAHKEHIKEQNYLMYIGGQYMMSAINATVGNMFKGKGRQAIKYEQEPFDIYMEKTLNIHDDMTDSEVAEETDKLWSQLDTLFSSLTPQKKEKDKQ